MNNKHLTHIMPWLLLLVLLAACGGGETAENAMNTGTTNAVPEAPAAVGSERVGAPLATPATGEKVATERLELDEYLPAEGEVVEVTRVVTEVVMDAEMRAGDTAVSETSPASLTLDQNSRLTAGEVDDNAQWDDYLLFLRAYQGAAVLRVDVSECHQIWVEDSQGLPVVGREVQISAVGQVVATLRTHSDGRVYFFPKAYPVQADAYQVTVTTQSGTESFAILAGGSQREWFVTLPESAARETAVNLDILFLIDATGSMADEINQLKENIRAISAQIDALPSQPDVRFGMVAYRDRGDAFLTQVTDFTPDVAEFAAVLAQLTADGGGDYPEDLNQAFSEAIHEPEWRVTETVSLIFLVADAPPHLDYGQQNHYAAEMAQAAARGIKVYPIASSGLDSQGEYIFRQIAQFTGGRFIFLTYGVEGPGSSGTETSFNVSDYTVASLDALVVRIVEEELAHLAR